MRRAAKTDANQARIVDALRRAGASVQSLAAVGDGVPDLLVGYKGETILMEVKDGSKPLSQRKLTKDQESWHGSWSGGKPVVVNNEEEALNVLGHI